MVHSGTTQQTGEELERQAVQHYLALARTVHAQQQHASIGPESVLMVLTGAFAAAKKIMAKEIA